MLLAINTSTLQFGLALLDQTGTLIGECYLSTGKRHFGGLFPTLEFLLTTSGTSKKDIRCIVIALGPGSFTGLRVGLASAKGLSHALEAPLIGVSSLEALASQIPSVPHTIHALLESRKNDVFTASFSWGPDGLLVRKSPDQCMPYSELSRLLDQPCIFVGNNYNVQAPKLTGLVGERVVLAPPEFWNLKASSVGAIGLKRFLKGEFDNGSTLAPIYLRPPDIRPNPYIHPSITS
ncbi:MAG: tRNA (adenosine(37)-N6)-threonylcarbamoyltransferase complex dimerization subunit type 1 TsaB [Deltaproteobacteria bacterium]|nr:MAG: tRNA (adenosine(37)-N6)-threonylcarbamoyltransferase complex dimerization subunit type 1 TsaB [Deltaproteobacteria bacterium]